MPLAPFGSVLITNKPPCSPVPRPLRLTLSTAGPDCSEEVAPLDAGGWRTGNAGAGKLDPKITSTESGLVFAIVGGAISIAAVFV